MKKILSLFALVLLSYMGAWAQTFQKMTGMECADSYENIQHWYSLTIHSDKNYLKYEAGQTAIACNSSTMDNTDKEAYAWAFIQVEGGYKIVNKKAGEAMVLANKNCTHDGNTGGNTYPILKDEATLAADQVCTFTVWNSTEIANANGFYIGFNTSHDPNVKMNRRNAKLAYWNGGADAGSTFIATEITFGVDARRLEAKSEIASLPSKVSVLFTNEALATANAAIDEATTEAAINDALNDFYRSAEGKKFTYSSTQRANGPWYMQANGETGALSSSKTVSARNVFELVYVGQAAYNVKSSKFGKSINSPGNSQGAIQTVASNPASYTIVTTANDNEIKLQTLGQSVGIHLDGQNVPCTWNTSADANLWTVSAISDEEYAAMNNNSINYTVTDIAGNEYTGSYLGARGDYPPFAGVVGQTYTNENWTENPAEGVDFGFTATINFPFPVSKDGVENYTYIGSFQSVNCLWYAKDNNLKMNVNGKPTNEENSNEAYMWAIFPTLNEGKFTFKIKNALGGYLAGSNTAMANAFVLNEEGRSYTYATHLTSKRGFYDEENSKLITFNSANSTNEQNAWLWSASGTHNGSNLNFYTPADFGALMTKLAQYELSEGVGKYSTNEENAAKIAGVKAGTQYATANEFNTMMNACTINQPTAGFYYFKGTASSHYMTVHATNANLNTTATTAGAANIFYLTSDNKFVPYVRPQYVKVGDGLVVADVAEAGLVTEFLGSPTMVGSYNVKVATTNNYFYDWTTYSTAKVLVNGEREHNRCQWTLEPVAALPVSISTAGYATLYAPVALSVPANVEAYTLTLDGDRLMAATVEGVIPANTGVVLKADAGTYDFAITTSEEFDGDNVLLGTVPTIAKIAGALVLGMNEDDEVGFYSLNDDVANLAGFKAYYLPSSGESNLRIAFDNELLTSILSAAQQNGGQAIYDLQGRRVVSAKGISIQAGKKVIK